MDEPRFDFITELFKDEPELEAEAQAQFLEYLRVVERIATRVAREEQGDEDSGI